MSSTRHPFRGLEICVYGICVCFVSLQSVEKTLIYTPRFQLFKCCICCQLISRKNGHKNCLYYSRISQALSITRGFYIWVWRFTQHFVDPKHWTALKNLRVQGSEFWVLGSEFVACLGLIKSTPFRIQKPKPNQPGQQKTMASQRNVSSQRILHLWALFAISI